MTDSAQHSLQVQSTGSSMVEAAVECGWGSSGASGSTVSKVLASVSTERCLQAAVEVLFLKELWGLLL